MKLAALAAALLLAVGCAACGAGEGAGSGEQKGGEASIEEFGAEAEGSDREQILGAFADYMDAVAEKDYGAACAHLSATVQSSLERLAGGTLKGRGCEQILPELLSPAAPRIAREQANGKIAKVRVEGDRAFVVFAAPGAELYQLTMVREEGRWRAATVAATVLVPSI